VVALDEERRALQGMDGVRDGVGWWALRLLSHETHVALLESRFPRICSASTSEVSTEAMDISIGAFARRDGNILRRSCRKAGEQEQMSVRLSSMTLWGDTVSWGRKREGVGEVAYLSSAM
jgi:hypothetical protein